MPWYPSAMAKKSTVKFVCRECGSLQSRWMGKCPDCGTWDALEEHIEAKGSGADSDPHRSLSAGLIETVNPIAQSMADIRHDDRDPIERWSTGISEFDRVLGRNSHNGDSGKENDPPSAGVVPGSAVLLGGDPGIGKSTILLQVAGHMAAANHRVLYVTSEESAEQLRLRADRLHVTSSGGDNELFVLADTNLARIIEQVRQTKPRIVIIDSIQMIYKGDLPAAPGSVTQLRTCCLELIYMAKTTGCSVFFIGHVTKKGELAGPRLLEHMVDTVLYFEGDRYHSHRVVRGIKNRFGNTLEVGIFEMTDGGLTEVADGSGLLAAEYKPRAGSVVCPVLQGSRTLLVEIQALTATGFLGSAKRKTSGLDASRIAMLIAVLEKHAEQRLADQDIFASSVGGMKIAEPAADLAVGLAIAGTHMNRSINSGVCAVGEIGLGGEVRHVNQLAQRLSEASRLGFTHIMCANTSIKPPKGCTLIQVGSLNEAINHLS